MTGFEANNLLSDAIADLQKWQSFGHIDLYENMSIVSGETVFDDGDKAWHFLVGDSEFVNNKDHEFEPFQVVMPVINLYHEVCGHGLQQCVMYGKQNDVLSKVLCMNYCACMSSDKYYGADFVDYEYDPTYFKQPYEMAAQYIGLRWAYDYLTTKSLPFNLDAAFVEYQRFRTSDGDGHDFIKWDPTTRTASSILRQYEKTFPLVVRSSRGYDHGIPVLEDEENYDDDLIRFQRHLGDKADYLGRLERCNDGMKQDWMAAAVYFRYHPDRLKLFPSISGLDVDVRKTYESFSKPCSRLPRKKDLDLTAMDKLLRSIRDDADVPDDTGYDFEAGP